MHADRPLESDRPTSSIRHTTTQYDTACRNLTARAQREFAKRHPRITVPLKRVIGGGTDQHAGGGAGGAPESSHRAKALAASGFVFGLATPRKCVSGYVCNPKIEG